MFRRSLHFTLIIGVVVKKDSTVTKCQFNAKNIQRLPLFFSTQISLRANSLLSEILVVSVSFFSPTSTTERWDWNAYVDKICLQKYFKFLRAFISQAPRNWLKQDLEGVKSSSFDFFRTISRKTTQQHKRRSIWIMPTCPSAEKHKMFIHAIQTSQIIEILQDHFPNVVSRKKNCGGLLRTSQDRIWIMLRQILWKSVTGKQRNGEMFWKTVTNDQCFFGNNKIASWSKGFFERFSAISVTWSSHQSAPTYYVGASSTPF